MTTRIHTNAPRSLAAPALRLLQAALATGFAGLALVATPSRADLSIGPNPLYLVMAKANVLVIIDNSNSMDEDASGAAVGSNSASSKSEIARGVVRDLTDTYRSRVNMGLMAYKQNAPSPYQLHNSPYDAGYDPGTYDSGWTGARASATHKKYRIANPTSPGDFIYYNVGLPMYDGANQGNAFCYSSSANAANDFVDGNGQDTYRCFRSKTGTSNTLPVWGNVASEAAAGYGTFFWQVPLGPTDSDYAQGISDFGRFLVWNWVSPTWFANASPGRGYLYVPLKDLGDTQAAAIKAKLACNIPGTPACPEGDPTVENKGIRNAGLTPIEGTLLTAKDYFGGGWNKAGEGYNPGCYPLPKSCGKDFVIILTDGLPSTDKNGNTLADPVKALEGARDAAAALKGAGVETYVIGFAMPYGVDVTKLDQVAAAGGTVTAHNAGDTVSLKAAFNKIFEDIFKKTSAFGSVSQNSTAINTGSMIFQGRFDSTNWSGEIAALRPDATGLMTPLWSSATAGLIPGPGTRKVYTLNPSAGGKEFKLYADLAAAQQTALAGVNCSAGLTGEPCAQARINWLRGDDALEDSAGPLRKRSGVDSNGNPYHNVHGDVISSAPFYVKATNTVYVGANDGMLHALDAANGKELFAFIPNAAFPKLYKLTQPSYSHEYFVDGDIAVSTNFETPGKSILVGALGRGGKALYALDVSAPASFDASKVMWEFTDPDLGLVLGKPIIVKLNNGKAAVVVGNGYNSATERSMLFIIDLQTGALIRKIDTMQGSAALTNGLATPRGWDNDGNGTVDYLYAGDLLGNLWKFDLTSGAAADWGSAFSAAGAPLPFFVAVDGSGNAQAITGMPGLGINARKGDPNFGKVYVFFGTGRYITSSDVSNAQVQSWYGLIESGVAITNNRTDLRQRSIELTGTVDGQKVRAFSLAAAGDMAGKKGWYIDLVPPAPAGAAGERMIGENKLLDQVLLATSLIPDSNECKPGGTGFLNALDPFTGGSLTNLFFDANNDLTFNDSDRLGADKRAIGSIDPGIDLPSDAILIGNRIISSGTSGNTSSKSVRNVVRTGRISWREVVTK